MVIAQTLITNKGNPRTIKKVGIDFYKDKSYLQIKRVFYFDYYTEVNL